MKRILTVISVIFIFSCTAKNNQSNKGDKFGGLNGEIDYIIDTLYMVNESGMDVYGGTYKKFFNESGDIYMTVLCTNSWPSMTIIEYNNGKPCLTKEYESNYIGEEVYGYKTTTKNLYRELLQRNIGIA